MDQDTDNGTLSLRLLVIHQTDRRGGAGRFYSTKSPSMVKRNNNKEMVLCLFPLQISICDDYSLPVDFVNKKRPSSFDPCLADSIPNNWTSTGLGGGVGVAAGAAVAATTSPLSDHVRRVCYLISAEDRGWARMD